MIFPENVTTIGYYGGHFYTDSPQYCFTSVPVSPSKTETTLKSECFEGHQHTALSSDNAKQSIRVAIFERVVDKSLRTKTGLDKQEGKKRGSG